MRIFKSRWSWQDWSIFTVRTVWIILVIIFMYKDKSNFPFWMVCIALLVCSTIPFLFAGRQYYRYFISECLIAGGFSLFLAYHLELTRLFAPILFTIAFYSRGKQHWFSLPISVILFILIAGDSVVSSLTSPLIWQSLMDALIFYGVSFSLQMGAISINAIKQKLKLIEEQYSILVQYSSQIEKMTLLEERYRMARELHDTIGHSFTSMILGMETLSPHIYSSEGKTKLQSMLKLARTGLEDIRRQVHQMDPLEENLPLDRSLLQIMEEFKTNTGVHVIFRTMGEPYPVMKQAKLTLYRCLQETLTNASRHGQASSIQVLLQYDHAQIMLQVQDNGKGSEKIQYGYGLSSMRERLAMLQGKFYIDTQKDEGTIITCMIPNQTNEGSHKIKILIVDDQPLVRESLRLLLGEEKDFQVFIAGNGKQAIEDCQKNCPDIILMDINMPEMDGITATKIVKETWPHIRVIMITTIEDVSYAATALRIGAEGYILKSVNPKELAATIRLIYGGGTMITQDVAQQLLEHQMGTKVENPYQLTERELEILRGLAEGTRNKILAQKLYLSEGTIRNYISTIYSKLQVQGRDEAVEKAKRENLIQ